MAVLCDALVPQLKNLIDADDAAGRPQDRRLRVGLYSYSDSMTEPASLAVSANSTVAHATDPPPPKTLKGARS